jgi:hypothetical protein
MEEQTYCVWVAIEWIQEIKILQKIYFQNYYYNTFLFIWICIDVVYDAYHKHSTPAFCCNLTLFFVVFKLSVEGNTKMLEEK